MFTQEIIPGTDFRMTMVLDADLDEWSRRNMQVNFIRLFCQYLRLPFDAVRIEKVERGSTVVFCVVRPPHGQTIIEQLMVNDNADSQLAALGNDLGATIKSVQLGQAFHLNVTEAKMNAAWNRIYLNDNCSDPRGVSWQGSLPRGGKPYFNPKGKN
jgi:hypothetical protein